MAFSAQGSRIYQKKLEAAGDDDSKRIEIFRYILTREIPNGAGQEVFDWAFAQNPFCAVGALRGALDTMNVDVQQEAGLKQVAQATVGRALDAAADEQAMIALVAAAYWLEDWPCAWQGTDRLLAAPADETGGGEPATPPPLALLARLNTLGPVRHLALPAYLYRVFTGQPYELAFKVLRASTEYIDCSAGSMYVSRLARWLLQQRYMYALYAYLGMLQNMNRRRVMGMDDAAFNAELLEIIAQPVEAHEKSATCSLFLAQNEDEGGTYLQLIGQLRQGQVDLPEDMRHWMLCWTMLRTIAQYAEDQARLREEGQGADAHVLEALQPRLDWRSVLQSAEGSLFGQEIFGALTGLAFRTAIHHLIEVGDAQVVQLVRLMGETNPFRYEGELQRQRVGRGYLRHYQEANERYFSMLESLPVALKDIVYLYLNTHFRSCISLQRLGALLQARGEEARRPFPLYAYFEGTPLFGIVCKRTDMGASLRPLGHTCAANYPFSIRWMQRLNVLPQAYQVGDAVQYMLESYNSHKNMVLACDVELLEDRQEETARQYQQMYDELLACLGEVAQTGRFTEQMEARMAKLNSVNPRDAEIRLPLARGIIRACAALAPDYDAINRFFLYANPYRYSVKWRAMPLFRPDKYQRGKTLTDFRRLVDSGLTLRQIFFIYMNTPLKMLLPLDRAVAMLAGRFREFDPAESLVEMTEHPGSEDRFIFRGSVSSMDAGTAELNLVPIFTGIRVLYHRSEGDLLEGCEVLTAEDRQKKYYFELDRMEVLHPGGPMVFCVSELYDDASFRKLAPWRNYKNALRSISRFGNSRMPESVTNLLRDTPIDFTVGSRLATLIQYLNTAFAMREHDAAECLGLLAMISRENPFSFALHPQLSFTEQPDPWDGRCIAVGHYSGFHPDTTFLRAVRNRLVEMLQKPDNRPRALTLFLNSQYRLMVSLDVFLSIGHQEGMFTRWDCESGLEEMFAGFPLLGRLEEGVFSGDVVVARAACVGSEAPPDVEAQYLPVRFDPDSGTLYLRTI